MKINVFESFDKMSYEAAEMIINYVNNKPNSLLTFANGNSPSGVFKNLVQAKRDGRVDLTRTQYVILDDFIGISMEEENNLYSSLKEEFFIPGNIQPKQIHNFNTRSENLELECQRIDNIIFENGGLDIVLLGIGMNGHLGFNEPGASFESYTHIVDLDETTRVVAQQYFKDSADISKGITLGIKHLLESTLAIGIADGTKKADIVKKWLEGETTIEVPCSSLNLHPNAYLFLDEGAYSNIQ